MQCVYIDIVCIIIIMLVYIVDNAYLVDMNSMFLDYLADKDRLQSALDLLLSFMHGTHSLRSFVSSVCHRGGRRDLTKKCA